MTTTPYDADPAARRRRLRKNARVFSLIGLAMAVVLGVLGAHAWFTSYDRSHVIRVTCHVTSAEGGLGGSARTLLDQVDIRTSDCGALVLRQGISADDKDAVARTIEDEGRVSFRIGELSYRYRDVLPELRVPVQVYSYRPAA